MNKIIRIGIALVFSIFISSPCIAVEAMSIMPANANPDPSNIISMDFQNADLKTVLKIFSQQAGLNFVASQKVKDRTVTIYFDNVSVEDALNHIMDANNLMYEQKPGSNIFIVKESGKEEVETITKIYELKYAQLSSITEKGSSAATQEAEIVKVLKGILTKNGKIVTDKRSNNLIIKDVPSQFAIIEDVISRLDIRTPQVMIEAEIIETTTALIDYLGVNWSSGTGTFGAYNGPVQTTNWPYKGKLFDEGLISTPGGLSFAGTTANLHALMTSADTKILARPKVLTMNNETARIELSSKEIAIATEANTTSNDVTSTGTAYEEKDTGVILEVTPQISKDGYITMHIKPDITSLAASRFTGQFDTHKRATETTVMVKDGETVVIGGLIKATHEHSERKIPFLGDIPVLGYAFRYRSKDDADKELIIFITPRIVKDSVYALTNISEREQEKPKTEEKQKEVENLLDLFGEIEKKLY
ncbi:MAG: hypothetical protein KJ902_03285 [Candidatus Omnitrophica bacterium]|nr:hypothetical protein [Candidatus Omnitrophota bacterium]MBU4457747.1 hypothetical protein [Candidatus Omnitrophota bacterium]